MLWPGGHGLEGEFIICVSKQGREVEHAKSRRGLQREIVTIVSKKEPHGRGGVGVKGSGRWGRGNAAAKDAQECG